MLLLIPALIGFLWWADRRAGMALSAFGEPALLDRSRTRLPTWIGRLRRLTLLAGIAFLLVSAARPQWGERIEEIKRKGLDVMIVLDVSASMDVQDIKPSRIEAAKAEIAALLNELEGDRAGLVCFAGDAALVCPLTLDYSALRIFLDSASTATISRAGTSVAAAIENAMESFKSQEKKYKVIVLITDGESHEDEPAVMAAKARDAGIVIYAVGVGTPAGELVPLHDHAGRFIEYKKDESGELVRSRLDADALQEIATTTGGKFFAIASGGDEVQHIAEEIAAMDKKEVAAKLQTVYEERFQWFLLPGLICLLVWACLPELGRSREEARVNNVA